MAPAAYVDDDFDESEIDFSDIEAQYAVDVPTTFDTAVVVDGVPIVGEAKMEKLITVIRKTFKNIGDIKENGIHMPRDPKTGMTKGFMFIDFATPEQAALAVKQADGHKFDTRHTFRVNHFDDIERFVSLPDTFEEPPAEEYKEKEHLKSWLLDPRARDQWVMMRGEEVGIYWNNKGEQPDLVHTRNNWSDMYVSWSPKGTYLATFHKQGIVLWGGPSWSKLVRFAHPNVKLIDFSPNEKYLVTWSHEPFTTADGEQHHIIIWDIVTGQQLRSFPTDASSTLGASTSQGTSTVKIDWPIFKWSHDDQYVARMTPGPQGAISVYVTPGMGLFEKKSFKIENVQSFAWSPKDHILSYWVPEKGNIPARVTLQKLATREILRQKNLFNVIDCKLFWQSEGDYLSVLVERAKSKKQTVTNIELFRYREKDIPVDVVELKQGEDVTNLFWEPNGSRFALLSQEGQNKTFVHFYHVVKPGAVKTAKKAAKLTNAEAMGEVKLLKTVEAKGINQVIWSPKGRFCVLGGVRGFQGDLQFWDIEDLQLMNTGEHYMCTDVEWDPTGRYVMSSVSHWRVQNDTGFTLWTFTGQILTRQNVPLFKQLLWRPRPPTLLTPEEQAKIRKNLKEYSREFDEADAAQTSKVSREVLEKRSALLRAWKEYVARCEDEYRKQRNARIEIYGFDPDEEDERAKGEKESLEEWVEEVIEETEEVVE
ncbi:Translation initiation factor 3 subunit b [Borealophlyctis nickersoniae]|nr:Translation initiation factor 3 subunit b [Borealophlyctis nickersoniae]